MDGRGFGCALFCARESDGGRSHFSFGYLKLTSEILRFAQDDNLKKKKKKKNQEAFGGSGGAANDRECLKLTPGGVNPAPTNIG